VDIRQTSGLVVHNRPAQGEDMILIILLTASFTLAVDFSILTVALPVIGADVGFPLAGLQWIVTAFALCAAGFTLLFGRLADLIGRKRLFLTGIAVLGLSSLAGGLATTPAVLLGARIAQGLATAAITPAALSLLTTSFPEGPRRDRALGLNGALMAAGFTTGAIVGGVLTDLLTWRWAFFLNVVVAAVVLAVGPFVLTETRPGHRTGLDLPGAVTVTCGLLALVYGLSQASAGALAAGAVLLVLFVVIESRVAHPLVPVAVLRRRPVAVGNLAGVLAFATETSLVFVLTLYLQDVLGLSPLVAGLSFAVLGAGTVFGGLAGPRLIARLRSAPRAIAAGMLVQAAATFTLVALGPTRTPWLPVLLVATFVGGVANLIAIVGFMVTATTALPDGEQGVAAGLATMSQQIGITLGIPVMSAVITATVDHGTLTALRVAIATNGAICVAAAILVSLALRTRRTADSVR
jgi:MFS family permease